MIDFDWIVGLGYSVDISWGFFVEISIEVSGKVIVILSYMHPGTPTIPFREMVHNICACFAEWYSASVGGVNPYDFCVSSVPGNVTDRLLRARKLKKLVATISNVGLISEQ